MLLRCLVSLLLISAAAQCRYVMYLTGQHDVVPEKTDISGLTHIALAFMRSSIFNQVEPSSWPLFTTVDAARSKFFPQTAIMVAIGGWGDVEGFEIAAASKESRELFAKNVNRMVKDTGADGVDIDWEYPGGNGDDYKLVPNAEKAWQIEAYSALLSTIREALGPEMLLSAAVPGLPRDMMAFNKHTLPAISSSLDFFNVMTYDLMNRRDNITKHHAGIEGSLTAISAYEKAGVPLEKMNIGFAFYIKWFKTDPLGGCDENPVGCKTVLLEDPKTGADLGGTGGFSWHDGIPAEVSASFQKAIAYGEYDTVHGGHYYWDETANLWWTWETARAIARKFQAVMEKKQLGGVFAWGLGEDADDFVHLTALTAAVKKEKKANRKHQDEL